MTAPGAAAHGDVQALGRSRLLRWWLTQDRRALKASVERCWPGISCGCFRGTARVRDAGRARAGTRLARLGPRLMALPVPPPVLPMLSKRIAALPEGDGWIFEPKWDGFRALVFRDGDELTIQSRDEKPLNRYFPEVVEALKARAARALRARRRDRPGARLRARLRGAAAAHSPGGLAGEAAGRGDPGVGRLLRSAVRRRSRSARRPVSRAAGAAGGAPRRREAADSPDAGHHRSGAGRRLVQALRGRRARRRDGQAGGRPLRAEQTGHVQGEARARVRLRGRRLSLARARREDRRRLAAARALRRRRQAATRRRRRQLHGRQAHRAGRAAGALSRERRSPTTRGRSGRWRRSSTRPAIASPA